MPSVELLSFIPVVFYLIPAIRGFFSFEISIIRPVIRRDNGR